MVFQDYALWPHLDVADNVAFALRRRKLLRAKGCGSKAAAQRQPAAWAVHPGQALASDE
jgi:ABC-type Fe3+/spermidine/putrescine transport system ATPase subunit